MFSVFKQCCKQFYLIIHPSAKIQTLKKKKCKNTDNATAPKLGRIELPVQANSGKKTVITQRTRRRRRARSHDLSFSDNSFKNPNDTERMHDTGTLIQISLT